MAGHTRGPWYLDSTRRYVRYDWSGAAGLNLADTFCFGGPPEEQEANARLIAAAPDLLAACEEALRRLEGLPGKPQQLNMATADRLRAAIRQARGE